MRFERSVSRFLLLGGCIVAVTLSVADLGGRCRTSKPDRSYLLT